MKKNQRHLREFEKLKKQLNQIESIVLNTNSSNLWSHEASVRKKIKALKNYANMGFNDYITVYDGYINLLDEISRRLLAVYNKRNSSMYDFDEIIRKDYDGYLSSGIISVLITSHIPSLVADDFKRYFPENPKDEYEKARSMKRKFYLHLGDTNTGKTYNAIERLKQSEKGVYLAPLRILALENFERLNREGVPCNLITGEEEIYTEGASHVSSTIEKLDIDKYYDVAVIDEIQMIGNSQRGQAWTRAVLGIQSPEVHVCGAANSKELLLRIIEDCNDEVEVINYTRDTPLKIINKVFELKHAERGDALVVFSKKRVLEIAKLFRERGRRTSVIYGDLPPEVRRMQYDAFLSGESEILVTTDAIGMGVNLPIKRIIFMDIQKFDGEEVRFLTSQEIKQIAGRAGRKGIYDIGYVGVNTHDQLFIKENLEGQDEELYEAVLGPSEAILKVKNLPLREKIALWSNKYETIEYYRKMDVRDYLLILDSIKRYRLAEEIQYRLMKIPFDVNNSEILELFISYVEDCFKKGEKRLKKPVIRSKTLYDLELYYQKVNLYYSFCKAFDLDFDETWVYKERGIICEKINDLLLKL